MAESGGAIISKTIAPVKSPKKGAYANHYTKFGAFAYALQRPGRCCQWALDQGKNTKKQG